MILFINGVLSLRSALRVPMRIYSTVINTNGAPQFEFTIAVNYQGQQYQTIGFSVRLCEMYPQHPQTNTIMP